MNYSQKLVLTFLCLVGLMAQFHADEVAPAIVNSSPSLASPAPLVDSSPSFASPAPSPTEPGKAMDGPISEETVGTLDQPTGEAVRTETRTPDGSVITVTRFNGQIPYELIHPNLPAGNWAPFGPYGFFGPPA